MRIVKHRLLEMIPDIRVCADRPPCVPPCGCCAAWACAHTIEPPPIRGTAQVFLDVDDLKEGRGAEYVDLSHVLLVFVSAGYFHSVNCMVSSCC